MFKAGVERYTWPSHWQGVAFTLAGVDYSLIRVELPEIHRLRGAWPDELQPQGYPCVYAVDGDSMEVYPRPHCDLEMIQTGEQPITRIERAVRW